MPSMLTINLARPLKSATIFNGFGGHVGAPVADPAPAVAIPGPTGDAASTVELQMQIKQYQGLCQALQGVVSKINQFYEELFAGHNEAIARLSTEIARKVIMRNVADGDYEIESIVKETLKNAPDAEDIVIRLNPQDLADCRKAQEAGDSVLKGVELLADPDIGRVECILESPTGIIKSLIDEHLERISKALGKTE